MKTVIISAFPACGKTHAANHCRDKYSILDLDSRDFSADSTFPENYLNHIKENIGKYDVIFVSTHKAVREALDAAELRYCTVYPQKTILNEWVGRLYCRGDSADFVQYIIDNWDDFQTELWHENNHGIGTHFLDADEYLDAPLIDTLYEW
ncbi:MAG: hypothetical protein GX025_10580 [Clostridiales bacterium]|nr:hypothetical protein [Clostridiales bacterium]